MTETNRPAHRTMEPFDALMYRGEADPRGRSTLLGVFILDRAPEWGRLVETYERASRQIVALRERVVEPTVPITMPVWAIDPDFDLSYHLRRLHVPAPGTERELLEFLEPLAMAPLDRTRPLWEFMLIEGLEGGGAAFVTKMNHAVADGVGGQELSHITFDTERDAPPREMPPAPAADDLTPDELVRRAIAEGPATALTAAARGAQTVARVTENLIRRPGRTFREAADYAGSLRRIMGSAVEPSPLLRRRGLRRRLLAIDFPLDDLKAASKAAGGSLNDGFLAAVCGGLRLYHEKFGVPIESVPMAIPISLRTADDPAGGNRWSGAPLAPPVDEPDPAERIRRIRQQVLDARQEPAINVMHVLAPIAARVPMWVLAAASGGTAPDVQVSNVAGSPEPLYLAGAKVLKLLPFGPVPGPAAMITMNSYVNTCYVGINCDAAAITEPELFRTCLELGVDEVLSLRSRGTRRRRSASTART